MKANEKALSGEYTVYEWNARSDGMLRFYQTSLSPIRNHANEIIGIVGVGRDITNQITAAEELKRMNLELVEQRAEAERQREEAMEANRYKSRFLAIMSHELRTPLNSIIGFTNRVIKKCADIIPRTQLENLEIVRNEGEHLLGLINSLLDYSKIEAGKMDVYPEEFDLREIIDEVSALAKNLAEGKCLNYRQILPATEDILIFSDRLKVKQILTNLISNACKYSEKGTVTLSAAIEMKFYRLEVQDEGIGIPPEYLERIFEEFRQADDTYTRKSGGTGLGLSITKRFVELLGGRIEVRSCPGKGSTFSVLLPIRYEAGVES